MKAPKGAPIATIGAAESQFPNTPGCTPVKRSFTAMPTSEVKAMRMTEDGMATFKSARMRSTITA